MPDKICPNYHMNVSGYNPYCDIGNRSLTYRDDFTHDYCKGKFKKCPYIQATIPEPGEYVGVIESVHVIKAADNTSHVLMTLSVNNVGKVIVRL